MKTIELAGDCHITKGRLKQRWAMLTDDDLRFVKGRQDELIGRIQQRMGETRKSVGKVIQEAWSRCCDEAPLCHGKKFRYIHSDRRAGAAPRRLP